MVVVNFIIQNILTQAAITIALIAMLGLLLQRKSFGAVLTGTCSRTFPVTFPPTRRRCVS